MNFFSEKPNDTLVQDWTIIMQTVFTSKDMLQYQSNSLMYASIGLSVAAVLITIIYIYTCQLEKHKISTSAVWYLGVSFIYLFLSFSRLCLMVHQGFSTLMIVYIFLQLIVYPKHKITTHRSVKVTQML